MVFGPKPRDFSKKVNTKTKQLALRKALSERLKAGDVLVVDNFKLGSAKTKDFAGVLAALELKGTALIVGHDADKNLTLAARNMPGSNNQAYEGFLEAMRWYEQAEARRPAGNDDALLRWNRCARFLQRHPHLAPGPEERVEQPLE